MKRAKTERQQPSTASLHELPEVDFLRYGKGRPNPFARRIKKEGWVLVHDGPSKASLRAIPETDFSRVDTRANPYAKRIKAKPVELKVGRGRPVVGKETGPTVVKSVRLPPVLWKQLEERARSEGIALHALVRDALLNRLQKRKRVA